MLSSFLLRYKPIYKTLRAHKRITFVGMGSLILTNIFDVLPPLLIGKVVSLIISDPNDLKPIVITLAQLVAVTLFTMFFRYQWRLHFGQLQHKAAAYLRTKIISKSLKLNPVQKASEQTGHFMTLLNQDISAFRTAVGPGMVILLDGLTLSLFIPFMMWRINPQWTLLSLCFFPFIPFFTKWLVTQIRTLSKINQEHHSILTENLEESIQGMKVIKSFQLEQSRNKSFSRASQNALESGLNLYSKDILFSPLFEVFMALGVGVFLFLALPDVYGKPEQTGQLLAFFQYLQRMTWPLVALSYCLSMTEKGIVSHNRISKFLDLEDLTVDISELEDTLGSKNDLLQAKNLSYEYPDDQNTKDPYPKDIKLHSPNQPSSSLLSSLSFNIAKGQHTAFIGPTGSGKTTLLNLLLGQLSPSKGSISWQNTSTQNLSIAFQKPFILNASLIDNSKSFFKHFENTSFYKNLSSTELAKEIFGFKDKEHTLLGEKGARVSGGQKQRLELARALSNPQVKTLLLDHPLSALDSTTKIKIIRSLKLWTENPDHTLLLFCHDPIDFPFIQQKILVS